MATTYTLTGGLSDAGVPFAPGKAQAWIAFANAQTVINTDTDRLEMGRWKVDLDSNGDFSEVLPSTASGAGYDPDGGFSYRLYVEYRTAAPKAVRQTFTSAPFPLTANTTLTDALNGTIELTAVSAADWADFQAKYDEMAAIVATTDGLIATNVANPASLTADALSATYAGRVEAATYTYNADGTVATETVGGFTTTYTYNADGTVHTVARDGVTMTYTYNASGNVTAVA